MRKKVLLMGKHAAGKSSMRKILFSEYMARDTKKLKATIEVKHKDVKILGNFTLNLWDCGGQEVFMENYFKAQQQHIFGSVELLVYVFDVSSIELERDLYYYQKCIEAVLACSPEVKIFCLIHKMDLLANNQRELLFNDREKQLSKFSRPFEIRCFQTSIWDHSLYKTWSIILNNLVPNVKEIENGLIKFAELIEADEVLLFEKATFLVIADYVRKPHIDEHRFEKVSNIIKSFKIRCAANRTHFQSMEFKRLSFSAFLHKFTTNTFVLVILSDLTVPAAITRTNIINAGKNFEKFEFKPKLRISRSAQSLYNKKI